MSTQIEQQGPPKLFRALVLDATTDRANRFCLGGKNYCLSVFRDKESAKVALESEWEVVFTSLYLGNWNDPLELVPDLVSAFRAGKFKLLICYTPITAAGKDFMQAMKFAQVPAKWYPYNYNNPSQHNALEL